AAAWGPDGLANTRAGRQWLLERLRDGAGRGPQKREAILIIEDDEVSRYLLKGLLADTRYGVLEAAGGDEGLRLALHEPPRAIFLDLDMPDLNGFEVLRRLRAEPSMRAVPVIVHTSKVLGEDERRRLTTEVAAILPKESASREVALARLREALMKAGLGQ